MWRREKQVHARAGTVNGDAGPAHSDISPDFDPDAFQHADTYANPNTDGHRYADAHTHVYLDAHTHVNPNTDGITGDCFW